LPRPTAETEFFWAGCALGELRYQECLDCGQVQAIPKTMCSGCHRSTLEWRRSAGAGRVLSFTVVYRAPIEVFRAEVPYIIALIDMNEGFRLMANVKTGGSVKLEIDMPVRISFCDVEGRKLPQVEIPN
jgi:uncharacterized protein